MAQRRPRAATRATLEGVEGRRVVLREGRSQSDARPEDARGGLWTLVREDLREERALERRSEADLRETAEPRDTAEPRSLRRRSSWALRTLFWMVSGGGRPLVVVSRASTAQRAATLRRSRRKKQATS